jgi:replication fork protection complex subunit Tof1/Swi1
MLTLSLVVRATSDEIRTATSKNAKLKLLMTLSGFERLGPDDQPDAVWIIPSATTPAQLQDLQTTIEKYVHTIWTDVDGREPEDLLRRVKVTAAYEEDDEPRRDAFIDDSEGSDEPEDFMFPDNVRSKSNALDQLKKQQQQKKQKLTKNAESISGDALDERRKAREQAALDRRKKIRSELYIRDSDEEMDEEENRAFFEREEANRKKQAERVFAALSVGRTEDGVGKRRKSEMGGEDRRKRRRQGDSEDEMADEDGMEMMGIESTPSRRHSATSDDELDIEDTPLSSQSQASDIQTGKEVALGDIPQSRLNSSAVSKGRGPEDSDEEAPVVAHQRRRVRAGFILDDSDEE